MEKMADLSRPGTKARRLQDMLLAQWRRHIADHTLPMSGRFLFYERADLAPGIWFRLPR